MKAAFRRVEPDDLQRNRKWKSLACGLVVASAGVAVALGPFVPSRSSLVLLTVSSSSWLAGLVVGWRVRERKGSMGGMVSLLLAFPLGGMLVGFPQSAGLMWIVCLFVAVPPAAVGGMMGARAARAQRSSTPFILGALAFSLVLLAVGSRVTVWLKTRGFRDHSQRTLARQISRELISGADRWIWETNWQKGIWRGDYFVCRGTEKSQRWLATAVFSDEAAPRLIRLRASCSTSLGLRTGKVPLHDRLVSLGIRPELLQHARQVDRFWQFTGSKPGVTTFISPQHGDIRLLYEAELERDESMVATQQVIGDKWAKALSSTETQTGICSRTAKSAREPPARGRA